MSMFLGYGKLPNISQNGLVLYLDAGNGLSYRPGISGTTWKDLSGNDNNGTLTNGPTFNSGNGGYMVIDGVDDYIEVSRRNTNLEFQPNQPHSVFCWVYNLTDPTGAIVANMTGTSPFPGWNFLKITGLLYAQIITSFPANALSVNVNFNYSTYANSWVYLGYTYDGSSPTTTQGCLDSINFYVNGQLHTTGKAADSGVDGFNSTSEVTTYPTSQRFRVGSRWSASGVVAQSSLNIASTSLYNRRLLAAEVLQNFNATRSRFGV